MTPPKIISTTRVPFPVGNNTTNYSILDRKSSNPTDCMRSEITIRSHDSDDDQPISISPGGCVTKQSRSSIVSFDRRLNQSNGNRVGGIILATGTGTTSGIESERGEEEEAVEVDVDVDVEDVRGMKKGNERISGKQNSQSKYDQDLPQDEDNSKRKISYNDLMSRDHILTLNRNLSNGVVPGPGFENLGLLGNSLFNKEIVIDAPVKTNEMKKSKSKCLISFDILVVDDSKLNRKMLCKVLRSEGHSCDEAEDGINAVQKVRTKMNNIISKSTLLSVDNLSTDNNTVKCDDGDGVGKPYFDAILMDFVMPNMDGPTGIIFVSLFSCLFSFINC